ncbi:MAG: hypothetical protein AAF288_12285 [Planctomycetota bacterium]
MLTPTEQAAEDFCFHPGWEKASWISTALQCHPSGEAPPLLGLVFADQEAGADIFRAWVDAVGHADEEDDLRVALLIRRQAGSGSTPDDESDAPALAMGYMVRLSPALQEFLDKDDPNRVRVGQTLRTVAPPNGGPEGAGARLAAFLRDYRKHGEFMLAPAVEREGQLFLEPDLGIIKRELVERAADDVPEGESDALAMRASAEDEVLFQDILAQLWGAGREGDPGGAHEQESDG